jgi:hypothetical protein
VCHRSGLYHMHGYHLQSCRHVPSSAATISKLNRNWGSPDSSGPWSNKRSPGVHWNILVLFLTGSQCRTSFSKQYYHLLSVNRIHQISFLCLLNNSNKLKMLSTRMSSEGILPFSLKELRKKGVKCLLPHKEVISTKTLSHFRICLTIWSGRQNHNQIKI